MAPRYRGFPNTARSLELLEFHNTHSWSHMFSVGSQVVITTYSDANCARGESICQRRASVYQSQSASGGIGAAMNGPPSKPPSRCCYCRNTSSSSTTSPGKSGVVNFSLAANRWIGFSRSSSNANRESSHGTGSMIHSSFTPSLA
jgi:hypothetical protein